MYKKDTELFLVKCKRNISGIIQSKREIQNRLIKDNYDGITSIESINVCIGDNVKFSYFVPQKIGDNLIYQANKMWHEIIDNNL